MATEKRKIHRVIDAAGNLVQVLPETSAEQVTLADTANNYSSSHVEGALAEVATSIKNLESGVASAGKVDDVQDVNGSSIVTNKIAKLTKAAVGLGNVDNTADANKSVKHATSADSATTATSATTANSATKATQDASGNVITSTYATKNELRDGLAGRATTKTYENYQAFVTAVNAMNNTALKVGDNVYIKKLDVPDMWVTAVNAASTSYTYTTDQAIINALDTTNGLTVGYFSFSKLETEKVDLSTYQTKTDNSLATTNKTVVGAINEVRNTANSAASKATTNATEIANIKNGTTVVPNANKVANALTVKYDMTGTGTPLATPVTYDGSAAKSIILDSQFTVESTTEKANIGIGKVKEANHATSADTANRTKAGLSFYVDGNTSSTPNYFFNGDKEAKVYSSSDIAFVPYQYTNTFQIRISDDFKVGTSRIEDGAVTDAKLATVSGLAAGQYSAVNVNNKGRVTAGGYSHEFGTSGQTTPSANLMLNGIFWELQ